MTVGLAMIVKDAEYALQDCLNSTLNLVDSALIIDTGSSDDTVRVARDDGAEVVERPWVDFGHNRTELLQLAQGRADWLLLLDADMTVTFHPGLKAWLEADPDPFCDAWMVEVREFWGHYRLPLLVRGGLEWRYEGRTHEGLDKAGRKDRPLLGLVAHHKPSHGPEKYERDLDLLQDGYEAGKPRETFYYAQTLRGLGRTDEAVEAYRKRAGMGGWDEEAWYAEYQAALLSEDVDELIMVYASRPWRAEPLAAAAAIVRDRGSQDDVLFMEA